MVLDSDIRDRLCKAARLFAVVCGLLFFLAPHAMAAQETLSLRYFRSVHVVRQLVPGSLWPAVTVPSKVKNHDTTNALLAHPDKSFVLESLARDFEAAVKTKKFPESGYYAAHTLAMLGRHAAAADAMKTYLPNVPFREEHYLFLVRELHAAEAHNAAITAVRQWQSLGNATGKFCSEERLAYAWGSFQALGMYREAMEEVLSDPCGSWQGQVFFAKSSLDLGDVNGAYARIASVMQDDPDRSQEIEALWDRLSMYAIYP